MTPPPHALPRKVHGDSILADDGSFLWLAIPKNASRSLRQWLSPRGRSVRELAGGERLQDWLARADLPAWSFAAVRHPEARVVSAWTNKLQSPPDTPSQARLMADNPGLVPGMTLDAFIGWLAETVPNGRAVDNHWRPQHHFIYDRQGVRRVDHIVRCEQLAQDLATATDRLGGLEGLPWLNRTGGADGPVALAPHQRRAVRDIYARDFELLGYD